MHISLDSALGQQRRLNQVGESITQIAPDPAAAYSLRSLTGGDPKVVRVRRASDNHEQDFTASDVSSGALVDFVNAQVVAPLDIQALSATGRDGDFLIAKAAYSLRSLGTRQATLAATGDTVARADGKFVCQVRRSSDDALKSFTADEITDGTLLSFVGTSGSDNGFVKTWYDQSVDAGGGAHGNHATQATAAEQPKIVSAGSLITGGGIAFDGSDDQLDFTALNATDLAIFSVLKFDSVSGQERILGEDSSNSEGFGIGSATTGFFRGNGGSSNGPALNATISTSGDFLYSANRASNTLGFFTNGVASATATNSDAFKANSIGGHTNPIDGNVKEIIIYETDQTDNRTAIEANIGEVYSIDLPSGVDPGFDQVDGFVETWYDQSGNGKDAVQTTAANQPKIVSSGTILDELDFDGTDDKLDIDGLALASLTYAAFVVASIDNNTASALKTIFDTSDSSDAGFAFAYGNTANKLTPFWFDGDDTSANVFGGGSNLTTSESLYSLIIKSGASTTHINGSLNETLTNTWSSAGTNSFSKSTIGYDQSTPGRFFNGKLKELIIYTSDETSNRSDIETNINSHYSIF